MCVCVCVCHILYEINWFLIESYHGFNKYKAHNHIILRRYIINSVIIGTTLSVMVDGRLVLGGNPKTDTNKLSSARKSFVSTSIIPKFFFFLFCFVSFAPLLRCDKTIGPFHVTENECESLTNEKRKKKKDENLSATQLCIHITSTKRTHINYNAQFFFFFFF